MFIHLDMSGIERCVHLLEQLSSHRCCQFCEGRDLIKSLQLNITVLYADQILSAEHFFGGLQRPTTSSPGRLSFKGLAER